MKTAKRQYAKDEDMYTNEQKKLLFTTLFDFLWYFGYWKSDDPAHEEFQELSKYDIPDYLKGRKSKFEYCGYHKKNRESLDHLNKSTQEERAKK